MVRKQDEKVLAAGNSSCKNSEPSQSGFKSNGRSKASLLMGAAIVIFTLSIGRADQNGDLANGCLGISAFISACLAIASVLPSIGAAPVKDDKANVLFLVFSEMKEEQFADAVIESLSDEEEMFRLMLRDIYQNGQVLRHKKYKLLGWSYQYS